MASSHVYPGAAGDLGRHTDQGQPVRIRQTDTPGKVCGDRGGEWAADPPPRDLSTPPPFLRAARLVSVLRHRCPPPPSVLLTSLLVAARADEETPPRDTGSPLKCQAELGSRSLGEWATSFQNHQADPRPTRPATLMECVPAGG